jgi:hypothetical protein
MSRHFFVGDDNTVDINEIVVVTPHHQQQAMKTRTAEGEITTQIMSQSDDDAVSNSKGPANHAVTAMTNGVRRRSLSMAETQPSVETVIVKAKRAAQSLWMLLHSQVSFARSFVNQSMRVFYSITIYIDTHYDFPMYAYSIRAAV